MNKIEPKKWILPTKKYGEENVSQAVADQGLTPDQFYAAIAVLQQLHDMKEARSKSTYVVLDAPALIDPIRLIYLIAGLNQTADVKDAGRILYCTQSTDYKSIGEQILKFRGKEVAVVILWAKNSASDVAPKCDYTAIKSGRSLDSSIGIFTLAYKPGGDVLYHEERKTVHYIQEMFGIAKSKFPPL